jgi:hypothetical protein
MLTPEGAKPFVSARAVERERAGQALDMCDGLARAAQPHWRGPPSCGRTNSAVLSTGNGTDLFFSFVATHTAKTRCVTNFTASPMLKALSDRDQQRILE